MQDPIPLRFTSPILLGCADILTSMEFQVNLIGRKNLSREIYRQLRRAIIDGRVRPGELLPPSRELALSLSVARTTVVVAYERLAGEGFVTSRIGAGTVVNQQGSAALRKPKSRRSDGALRPRSVWDSIPLFSAFACSVLFDFRTGLPDASLFPHDRWRRAISREL